MIKTYPEWLACKQVKNKVLEKMFPIISSELCCCLFWLTEARIMLVWRCLDIWCSRLSFYLTAIAEDKTVKHRFYMLPLFHTLLMYYERHLMQSDHGKSDNIKRMIILISKIIQTTYLFVNISSYFIIVLWTLLNVIRP